MTGGRGHGTPPWIIRPAGWPEPRGYSDGIIAEGRIVALAGQVGWNPETQEMVSDDFAEQAAAALRNMATILRAAGAEPLHLVRVTWWITDRGAYVRARRALGAAWRDVVGDHYPPMSVVIVSGLLEPRALVEIEATAVVPL